MKDAKSNDREGVAEDPLFVGAWNGHGRSIIRQRDAAKRTRKAAGSQVSSVNSRCFANSLLAVKR